MGHLQKYKHSEGYIRLYLPDDPDADNQGCVLEHRHVMSVFLGRRLKRSENVHHINNIKTDNRIQNLQLISHSAHMSLTHRVDMSERFCLRCGTVKTHQNKNRPGGEWYQSFIDVGYYCKNCYYKIIRVSEVF